MSPRSSSLLRLGAVVILAAAAACSDSAKKSDADADLAHDLALSNQVAQPQLRDTAIAPAPASRQAAQEPVERPAPRRQRTVTPAPRREPAPVVEQPAPRPAPAPVAAAPAPAAAPSQIGAGTGIGLTTGGRVCTVSNRPGDKIVASVNAPVTGQNGAVIPAGSSVVLEVASVDAASPPENSTITFRVRSIDINGVSYPASGDVTAPGGLERQRVSGQGGVDKQKVIGGAIAGAILGQIIGHNTKGTVIGAATGAAAGAAASKMDVAYEGCLPAGAPLRLTLSESLVLQAASR